MAQRILGIDLGHWSVKAVLLESTFRSHRVLEVAEIPIPAPKTADKAGDEAEAANAANAAGATDAAEDDPSDSFEARQAEALRELLAQPQFRADQEVASLGAEQVAIRFIELPFSDRRRINQVLEGELADQLPFDLDAASFDHAMLSKTAEGSLSLAAASPNARIEALLTRLQGAGLDPRALGVDVLQLYNLYTHDLAEHPAPPELPAQSEAEVPRAPNPSEPLSEGRMILDIGHSRTLLLVIGPDGPVQARVIRHGGADVTRAIAEAYDLSWSDAEAGKHEDAQLVSMKHPAPSDAAAEMSQHVAAGIEPLIRSLRRSIQVLHRDRRVTLSRIELLGGGSRIRHLAPYLAEALGIPVAQGVAVEQEVERWMESPRRPAFALALANALRFAGDKAVSTLDFRRGAFSFSGSLVNLRERLPTMLALGLFLLVLAGASVFARLYLVNKQLARVDEAFCEVTEQVVGRRVCEPAVALSMLRQPTGALGSFRLPNRSAFQVAADLSNGIPTEQRAKTRITEVDINDERARIEGETSSFEAVDLIYAALAENPCFGEIRKGRLNKKTGSEGVEFQLMIRFKECQP